MPGYAHDRDWADRFIPQIKQIVGPHLLSVTPDEIDAKQVADLWVLTARDMRIGARVRRHGYALSFPDQFTIRSRRESGAETELSKIVNGWGDWFFYGHADWLEELIEIWWLIDLHSFRAALIRHNMKRHRLLFGNQSNCDGTWFTWFDINSFPERPPLLIASSATVSAMASAA